MNAAERKGETDMNDSSGGARWSRLGASVVLILAVVFAIVVFGSLLRPGSILFTTDDNIGALAARKAGLPEGFMGWWRVWILAGIPDAINVCWTNILLWLLPVRFFTNWIHAIDLVFASFFFALFLRRTGRSVPACAIGALAAFWVGSNFTLTYAGHIGKFGVLMFAPAALWLIEATAQTRRTSWAVLAGGAIGGMFLEQADIALFFSIVIGPYLLFVLFREKVRDRATWIRLLAPIAVVAGLVAFRALWLGYQTGVKDVTAVQEDPREKWEFLTQWSWPPEESIDFIAPGYMGWRSGEPGGPYWGRMGRSAGWETTGQGFQNFKLENQYLGAIPLAFALLAVWVAWWARRAAPRDAANALFWLCATLLTLLLSFGKYFPLYRLFAMLPAVSSIRNPNKFLQVFQLALAVLAAVGADVLRSGFASKARDEEGRTRFFPMVVLALGAVLLLSAFSFSASSGRTAGQLAMQGWGAAADAIVSNRMRGLWHASLLTLAAGAAMWWLFAREANGKARRVAAWVFVLVFAGDALLLSRHYVQRVGSSMIEENDVIRFLKSRLGPQRVVLVSQGGFYNNWLTYLFPYHGIDYINVTQMPRMPEDYRQFLGAVGGRPLPFWQLMGIGFVVTPAQGWMQIQQDPGLKSAMDLVFAFNVWPDDSGGLVVTPGTQQEPGQHCILQFKAPSARYAALQDWQTVPDDAVLRRFAGPMPGALQQLLLAPADDSTPVPAPPAAASADPGEVGVRETRAGFVRLQTNLTQPAMIRIANKYDPDWKAYVDGAPAKLWRADYLFQAVHVPAGVHEVVLRYAPSRWPLWVQIAGLLACAAAVIPAALGRKEGGAA